MESRHGTPSFAEERRNGLLQIIVLAESLLENMRPFPALRRDVYRNRVIGEDVFALTLWLNVVPDIVQDVTPDFEDLGAPGNA
jgi:hypothetical protein